MGLSHFETIDRAITQDRGWRTVSAWPSALSTVTRTGARVAPQRCPILHPSALILTWCLSILRFQAGQRNARLLRLRTSGGRFFVIKMGDFLKLKIILVKAQVVDFLMLKWVIFLD
jgi:hypothetical protein